MKKNKKYNLLKLNLDNLLFFTNELANINNNTHLINLLGDYVTDDIANDWVEEQMIGLSKHLYANSIISDEELLLIKKIMQNFDLVSRDGKEYEEIIWTLEGLHNHPFWEKQRELAKELVILLEKDLQEMEKQEN